jgi:hypothetical protein
MQFRGASTPNNGVKLHDGWPVAGGRLADVTAEALPQDRAAAASSIFICLFSEFPGTTF